MSSNSPANPITDDAGQHFLFRCNQSWFAVPAASVRELTIAPEIVSVPSCHAVLDGLCRQQSEFIPVVALETLLDLDPSESTAGYHQLLTLSSSHAWSIRISEALGLESLEMIASTASSGNGSTTAGVVGTAKHGDRFVKVLCPDQLYGRTDQTLKSSWAKWNTTAGQSMHPTESQR